MSDQHVIVFLVRKMQAHAASRQSAFIQSNVTQPPRLPVRADTGRPTVRVQGYAVAPFVVRGESPAPDCVEPVQDMRTGAIDNLCREASERVRIGPNDLRPIPG
ncbi:MAG TPA: hypothetical protein VLB69_08265 [Rudaea sp.]|nr:hypothetical protein [Rudaea sp.]